MNCDRAQLALSARMDGEHVPSARAAEAHAASCSVCSTFVRRSEALRAAVRIRTAEPVPDLVRPIMDTIGVQTLRPRRPAPRRGAHRARRGMSRTLVAAAVAGTLVGSLLVGGPWRSAPQGPVALADVVRGIREAAPTVEAFSATFTIHEYGLSAEVPERSLDMEVAYLAPQRFRLEVDDTTTYPSDAWTPTDLLYIEDMPATYRSGPTGCPADLGPGVCPTTRETVSRTSRYSAAAPLPADLILPIATFGSADGVVVTGQGSIGGRDAVRLEMTFRRAEPMFPFLRLGGQWRPFFDRDIAVVWLDAETWFPLRSVVEPSADPARRDWELRFGRQVERPGHPILEVDTLAIDDAPPPASAFEIPGKATVAKVPVGDVATVVGYRPTTPTELGDLLPAGAVVTAGKPSPTPTSVLVYSNGLDYLRIAEDPDWQGGGPFGGLTLSAEQVQLAEGGVAYYEPAGDAVGRRVAIHTTSTDLVLETNLPRERLLAIASSVPVHGLAYPPGWEDSSSGGVALTRVPVAAALRRAGVPAGALASTGYVVASAEVQRQRGRVVGVTFHLHDPNLDAAGAPLSFHVERDASLPRAASSTRYRVEVAGRPSGWSPVPGVLEWAHAGDLRSLQGSPALQDLLAVADAIEGAGP